MDREKEIEQLKERVALFEKVLYTVSKTVMVCSIATLFVAVSNLVMRLSGLI